MNGGSSAHADRPGGALARRVLGSRTARQAVLFSASNALVSLLGMVSTALLARHLSTTAFGSFSFSVGLLLFIALFFEFGLFLPPARLAALTADPVDRRRLIGAAWLLYLPVGAAYCATVVGFAFIVNHVFNVDARTALLTAAPLAFGYPFLFAVSQISQGIDRLHVFSITSLGAQAFFLVFVLAAVFVGHVTVTRALVLRSAAFAVGAVAAAVWLRPVYQRAGERVRTIVEQARSYGFQVYLGRLLALGTYRMDILMLGGLATARSVGFYTLAGSIAYVVGLPMLGISTALFPRLVQSTRIGRRWLVLAWSSGIVLALVAWALADPFVRVAFSTRYLPAVGLVLPLALAEAVRSVTGIYNSFLSAKARGRELRNAGLVLAGSNLVLNLALIPPFGATGAAWASLAALVANLLAHVVSYRRSLFSAAGAPVELRPAL